jgi:hypothetical protein
LRDLRGAPEAREDAASSIRSGGPVKTKLTVWLLCLSLPGVATADKPIQLALVTPVQIFNAAQTITGFRLNLLYGRNADMNGFDLGLVNHVTGSLEGVQWGIVNVVGKDGLGWQHGVANVVHGNMKGFQSGVVNYSRAMKGLQLGVVNYAGAIRGLQVGLLNIIERDGWLPFMIILNGRL